MNKSKTLLAITSLSIFLVFSGGAWAENVEEKNISSSGNQTLNVKSAKPEQKQTGVLTPRIEGSQFKGSTEVSSFDESVILMRKDSGDSHLDSQKQIDKLSNADQ